MKNLIHIVDYIIGQKKQLTSEDKTRLRLIVMMLLGGGLIATLSIIVFWYFGNYELASIPALGLLTLVLQLGAINKISAESGKHLFSGGFSIFFLFNIILSGSFEITALVSLPFVTLSIFLFQKFRVRFFYIVIYLAALLAGIVLKGLTEPLYEIENIATAKIIALLITFVLQLAFSSLFLREISAQEKKIKRSKELLNDAQHQAKIGSFHHRFNSNWITYSKEFKHIFKGIEEENGIFGLLAVLPIEAAYTFSQFADNSTNGDKFSFQFESAQSDGVWYNVSLNILGDDKNQANQITGTIQDISELAFAKKAQQSSESKFQTMFEKSPFPLILCGKDGIVECNYAAVEFLDAKSKEEIYETKSLSWSPEFQPNGARSISESIKIEELTRLKGSHIFEWLFQSTSKRLIPTEVSTSPIEIDGEVMHFVILNDLTNRKLSEAQIKELLKSVQTQNEVLEQKVAARTASVEHSNLELKRSNKDLEHFAYAASHDLQEPLRMVGSFVQLLESEYKEILGEAGKQYVEFAVDGVKRMSELIKALLEYSQVAKFDIELLPCDLNTVVQAQISNLSKLIEEKEAAVSISALPSQLNVEKTMLGLVFQNLVTNAIKFNRNTKPTVQIKAIESDNDWRFEIKDNGIGIEEGNEEKVFQIFQRLHRKDEYAGTGIGLAMCRKIVERHQGKIWYDSDSGGTTFKFTVSKKLQEKCKAPQTKYSKSF